eukprot:TRINITY_DN17373_c0_g1_i1.p1 TRINITY_DN17373_c0_g1~~TRINITY_DN17373_c0_g1_i1.p1  ORF type:complete len:1186 (+),score=264.34 TRINITY_DN17373_c0_g1_i1:93-3560(+)
MPSVRSVARQVRLPFFLFAALPLASASPGFLRMLQASDAGNDSNLTNLTNVTNTSNASNVSEDSLDSNGSIVRAENVTKVVTLAGDYSVVIGSNKSLFLKECSEQLMAGQVTCIDVAPGSILLTLRASSQADLNVALQSIDQSGLNLSSFELLQVVDTTTSSASNTSVTVIESVDEVVATTEDGLSGAVIAIIVIGSLVGVVLLALCIYGIIAGLRSRVHKNRHLVTELEKEVAEYDHTYGMLKKNVATFDLKVKQDEARKLKYDERSAELQKQWQLIDVAYQEFLNVDYQPCVNERKDAKERRRAQLEAKHEAKRQQREKQRRSQRSKQIQAAKRELESKYKKDEKDNKAKGLPAPIKPDFAAEAERRVAAFEETDVKASLVLSVSKAQLEDDADDRCLPGGIVTSNGELQAQLKALRLLRDKQCKFLEEFRKLKDEVFPDGVGFEEIVVVSPASYDKGGKSWGWSGRGGSGAASFVTQVDLLKSFAHPALLGIQVKPYGVLGTKQGEKDPEPLKAIDAVVVDPAGWRFIGQYNNISGAGGASGSIYKWLGLNSRAMGGRFPDEVNRTFSTYKEVDAESRAKFHSYSRGQHVIHTVGPRIRDIQQGTQHLAQTYVNVFTEFCQAIAPAGGSQAAGGVPSTLRLCPISSGIFCEHQCQAYMADITWAAVSLAFVMLPCDLQDKLRKTAIEVCVFSANELVQYEAALDSRKALVKTCPQLDKDLGRIANHSGYDWVRKQNAPQDRLERLGALMLTAQAVAGRGYSCSGKEVKLDLTEMLTGTRVHRAPPEAAAEVPGAPSPSPLKVVADQEGLTVLEVASKIQQSGRKAVGVNAASAYSVGGGVLSGGRHALEESCCITSTLLKSLQKIHFEELVVNSNKQHEGHEAKMSHHRHDKVLHAHIPVDGCIVSPAVEVFRAASSKGYSFLESPVRLQGVCSMAMFNMNPRVADSNIDAPRDFTAYCQQVRQKFRAVVSATIDMGAQVLVCPDVGCGVFGNDAQVVGTLFGEVLREASFGGKSLSEVVVTGQATFAEAVRRAAAGEKVELQPLPASHFATVYGHGDYGHGRHSGGKRGSHGGWGSHHKTQVVKPAPGTTAVVNPVVVPGSSAHSGASSRSPQAQAAAPADLPGAVVPGRAGAAAAEEQQAAGGRGTTAVM